MWGWCGVAGTGTEAELEAESVDLDVGAGVRWILYLVVMRVWKEKKKGGEVNEG